MKAKKPSVWGWVLFWLIVFWPAGLILLFKKSNDKAALMSPTKAATVFTWILIVFGSLMLLANIERFFADFSIAVIFLAWVVGGVLILLKIRKTKAKAEQYKKYLNAIVNVGERSIDNIASAVSVTYGQAQADIQAMIDVGFLSGAYIHEGNRAVVLSQDIQAEQPAYVAAPSASGQLDTRQQPRSVRCPGCGASNVVIGGRITECEYCGTPLNG
ncbi:MAG: hypothetical protein ABT01_05110 [Clostridium sp. SCN 57-10]|nr:MAG: hypothetical protein ABT01_05110 [Clostridium sp. SCN 57-10]